MTVDGQKTIVGSSLPANCLEWQRTDPGIILQRQRRAGECGACSNASLWDEWTGYPSFAAAHLRGPTLPDAQTRLDEISTEEAERRIARAVLRLIQQAGRRVGKEFSSTFRFAVRHRRMTGTTLHTSLLPERVGAGRLGRGRSSVPCAMHISCSHWRGMPPPWI
jgi:hypothetical protein